MKDNREKEMHRTRREVPELEQQLGDRRGAKSKVARVWLEAVSRER